MKTLFVFCQNNLEILLQHLPESDQFAYFFFSEVKVLDIAIKQKSPDALLFKGAEFNTEILKCVSDNKIHYQTPIIFIGKAISKTSLPNFKIYNLPAKVNKMDLNSLFSEIKLIYNKPISSTKTDNYKIDELGHNNRLLDLLMDNLPDAVYFKDRESRYTKINYPEAAILQISDLESAIGKDDMDFFPAPLNKILINEEQEFMRSGMPSINKIKRITIYGEEKYMSATKVPLAGLDGKCMGLVGISRDVTKQFLAEKALVAEKELMDLLMNNLPDKIYFKDTESRFLRCNLALAKMFGVSSTEDLYGKTDFDFHDTAHAKEAFEEEQEIMSTLIPMINKEESYLKNGEQFWDLTTKIPLINDKNEVFGIIGISHDFTKQKQLEDKLEKEKEFLQILIDNIPDYVYFKDKDSKYIRVNKAALRVLNVESEDQVIGKSDIDFFPKDVADELHRQDLEVFKSKKIVSNSLTKIKNKNVNNIWVSSTKVPIKDENSKITGLVGISRDVTMEELTKKSFLTAKLKAEEANKAKSFFLANMSHEIRTPMNGIIGMADILSKSKLEPHQIEYLNIIIKSGQTLLSLINDILDFSKIESGKLELEIAPINIRSIIEEVADSQLIHAAAKSIDLLLYVDPEIPEFVGGDYVRLKQVITNLVNNAIKFTMVGEVVMNINYIGEKEGLHEIQFKVIDSGIGITKENQRKLFKSFSQVDASTTRKYGGSGLGLAISQRLVNRMGGNLEIDSSIDNGSTFFFNVKFAYSEENKDTKSKGMLLSIEQLCNKHIVIVDDNVTNRLIFRNYLETWKVKVTEFENAIEALSFFKKRGAEGAIDPIDLVLVDFHMPGMDGGEFAEQIKQDERTRDLKLILLSSITDAIPIKKMNEAGFETGLNKPIKMNQLLNVILKVLGMQQEQEILTVEGQDNQYLDYKNKRFLIAEDNPINIKVAKIMLSELTSYVEVANNGLEAVELFKTNEFDIILMDIKMPVMDGIQATIKIRALEKALKKQIPVKIIAMTANTFQEDIELCMKNGMDAFLEKPFKRKDLVHILRSLM